MQDSRYGVNSITVAAAELLLTAGGGSAVHLTATAKTGAGRPAVPEDCFTPQAARLRPGLVNYDRDALLAARWAPTTLCGRPWTQMVGGEGGSIGAWGEDPEFAPTCKRCLALLDRMFPPPPMHPQLPLVARVVVDLVADHGYAELHGVPGDQHTQLRRQVRSLIRQQTGHSCQTLVHESTVFVICRPILALHEDEHLAWAAVAMEGLLTGEVGRPRPDPEWRLFWSTWATG